MREATQLELRAKELVVAECKLNYTKGNNCFTKCRCRIDGRCKGLNKEGFFYNTDLIEILENNKEV